MKLRPTIFLSGVSSEFASFRDAVETEVQKKDCFPLNQPSFGVDYRTIEEILRRNIGEADAVIHIVGFRFGFEPRDRPPDKPRRSYTQIEYDIALELGKPVYVFRSADATVRDPNPGEQPEDAEAVQLQLEHRQSLEQSNSLWYTFQNKNDLCLRAANIPLLATSDFRVDISRIDKYAPAELIGREDELKLLDDAWLKVRRAEPKRPHILTFVALGGEGKTSLVAKWLANLAYDNWPGCDSAFAWSFYSQGSHEQSAASSDLFLKEAISFFGNDTDREFAASAAGAYEKGQRLARIVGQRRALLILDGLEPLQYLPISPTPGELKDFGIAALLKGLAADNDGLCVVTTRYSLPDLRAYWHATVREVPLIRLSLEAGVHLMSTLGVKGLGREIEKLVEDVKGHALTINLFGTYLRDAHNGDIRRRDLVDLSEADAEEQSGHAFRIIAAYEKAFEDEGRNGKRALGILRLLGLFDRPISSDCLIALLERPAIVGLTEHLISMTEAHRNLAFRRLQDANLLTVNREISGSLISIDAHPLLREYFAWQLRTQQPNSWSAAHRRLYEHLCVSTSHKAEPSLDDLQPLYQAVVHGCEAGLHRKAYDEVYVGRILLYEEFYSSQKLGALGSNLGAVACFFETPWRSLSPLIEARKASVLAEAAFYLRALGRLTESLEPMQTARDSFVSDGDWKNAAILSSNLSDLELVLGKIPEAVKDAEESLDYAEHSGDAFQRITKRVRVANSYHQAGHRSEAERYFFDAEQLQVAEQPNRPVLYAVQGFQYCDLLLGPFEYEAWHRLLDHHDEPPSSGGNLLNLSPKSKLSKPMEPEKIDNARQAKTLSDISQRAIYALKIAESNNWLLSLALDNLTLSRALLYGFLLPEMGSQVNKDTLKLETIIGTSVVALRRAAIQDRLLYGILTRAWIRMIIGKPVGLDSAQEDLDEAWEIAERGPMRLQMADIHLYRARLFFREAEYPWESPEADLAAARKLIEQCGYWRRKEELEDAERVILKKSV